MERGIWRTNNGKQIMIKDMETSHIKNTINWMKTHRYPYYVEYLRLFNKELNARNGGEGI